VSDLRGKQLVYRHLYCGSRCSSSIWISFWQLTCLSL